jgi:hypothetical protein
MPEKLGKTHTLSVVWGDLKKLSMRLCFSLVENLLLSRDRSLLLMGDLQHNNEWEA